MREYIIFTDSCCDIKPELLERWGVPYDNMTFSFDGEDKEYINTDITNKEFYDRMRKGTSAKTAAINADSFTRAFEPILQDGKDILYVAFSSDLSTTVNSAHMAAEEEFCDILDAILRNQTQRQAAGNQSAQIASCFDKSNFAEKIEDIYESVVP